MLAHPLPTDAESSAQATLIVDEIPGRLVGDDDEPPGRLLCLDRAERPVMDIATLKMPYDAAPTPDGCYLVSIIRAKAVWKVTPAGEVLWRREVGGYPCSVQLLPGGQMLVAGWDYHLPGFVREYDQAGALTWQLEGLRWPWKAQRLQQNHTLIADAGANRVFEVDRAGQTVWAVEQLGPASPQLFDALGPLYCQRLSDGNTLVSIRGLSKVLELNPAGQVVWELGGEHVANQYSAVRLANGNTLIADAGNFRVVELDRAKTVVWQRRGLGYPAKAYRIPGPGRSVVE